MYPRKLNWFPLLALILIAGLFGGCDGENQSVSESMYPRVVQGEISSVKPDTRKLVLKPASSEQGENTTEQGEEVNQFKVAKDATITVLGKQAQLADLKEGQRVEVQYVVRDRMDEAGGVKVTGQPPVAKTAAGEISVVKPASGKAPARISLKPTSVQDKTTMSFRIIQNATITLNGQDADLAELRAGQQAEIQYFVDNGINRAHSVKVGETAAVSDPAPG